jgi:hypothetical protein
MVVTDAEQDADPTPEEIFAAALLLHPGYRYLFEFFVIHLAVHNCRR